jgi:hypothetical protein
MASSLRSLAMTAGCASLKATTPYQGLGMPICLTRTTRLRATRTSQGDTTGSRRSKPLLKNLDFQIYSKYLQAFPNPEFRISDKYQTVKRQKIGRPQFFDPSTRPALKNFSPIAPV